MIPDPITGVEQRSGWAAIFTDEVGDFFKLGGNSGKVLSPSRSKALELNKLSLGKPQAEGVTAGRFGRRVSATSVQQVYSLSQFFRLFSTKLFPETLDVDTEMCLKTKSILL